MELFDHDEFNRPDGAMGSTANGRTWTHLGSGSALTLASNTVRGNGTGSEELAVVESKNSDGSVYLEVPTLALQGDGGAGLGVCFRCVDISNFWNFMLFTSGSTGAAQFYLQKTVAGSLTTVAGPYAPGTIQGGCRIRADFFGNSIRCFILPTAGSSQPDATPKFVTTDSALQTATKHGITSYFTTSARGDNWRLFVDDGRPGRGIYVPRRTGLMRG